VPGRTSPIGIGTGPVLPTSVSRASPSGRMRPLSSPIASLVGEWLAARHDAGRHLSLKPPVITPDVADVRTVHFDVPCAVKRLRCKPRARKPRTMTSRTAEPSTIVNGSLRKLGALPMVLRGFAVHAGHVLYRLARNGRSKPIEESHAVGPTSVEPIKDMRTSAVVERIYC
jgi:hypothetical protein